MFEFVRKRFQVELEDEVCDLCSEQFEEICVDSEKGECHGGSHEMSSKWKKTCPETLVPIPMHIELFWYYVFEKFTVEIWLI